MPSPGPSLDVLRMNKWGAAFGNWHTRGESLSHNQSIAPITTGFLKNFKEYLADIFYYTFMALAIYTAVFWVSGFYGSFSLK